YDEGGQLTEAIRRRPYSVVLFDEIEKAHHDVFNILLQILDDGRLTDNQGRVVNFKNTLIIMTSNIGSTLIAEGLAAENDDYHIQNQVLAQLRNNFRPEFLNRIDEIVVFKTLTQSELTSIVTLQIERFALRLVERQIVLVVSEKAKQFLARIGFDPVYGARPLKRAIQKHLETPLSRLLIAGQLNDGETVTIDENEGQLTFQTSNPRD
ncbi:MAG: AAA family ATPase, partial [Chitinivibrionales bacterium]|nr:AAA family ATPase [Chitinivibrionales bacterium]